MLIEGKEGKERGRETLMLERNINHLLLVHAPPGLNLQPLSSGTIPARASLRGDAAQHKTLY